MTLFLLSAANAGPNTVLVGYEQTPPTLDAEQLFCFEGARVCAFDFPAEPPLAVIQAMPGVRYAELDGLMHPIATPAPWDGAGTDDCSDPWEMVLLQAETLPVTGAWAPVVAIQDGGFLIEHEDLGAGRVSGQYDYGDSDTEPEVSWKVGIPDHGTFIAGVIAANPDNGVGRAGLAPDVLLNLQKIADSDGALYWSYAIRAMNDVADGDLGVRVVNYSLGSSSTTNSFGDAVEALGRAGVLMVVSAGNCSSANCSSADNDDHPMFPANYDEPTIVVVAGSLRDDSLNPYSHYGAWSVDLAAPGVDLCSLGAQGLDNYYTAGGTSYATPLVAAAAALVMEAHPDLTAIDVARVLRASALKVPELEGKVRSGGRLDVHQALNTPVPRLEEPPAVALDGRGSLPLSFRNPGGEGPGLLLLFHGPGFEVTDAEGWSTTAFSVGDVLDLPDAGSWSADAPGTLIEGTLAQHQVDTLQLSLSGRELGEQEFSVRLVATSADYLNAPYDEGSDDPTGFLAWSGRVTVTALDTGHDSADDSGVLDTPEKPSPQSCGCSAGSHASWSGLLALGLLWLGRRLRRKAPDKALS